MTLPTLSNPRYYDGTTAWPLSNPRYYDGTTAVSLTIRGFNPNEVPPPPPPPPSTTMLYGVSGTSTSGGFAAGYNAQVAVLHNKGGYIYGDGASWTPVGSIPSTHPLLFQTKQTTRSAMDAMLATFPATRAAPVYVHWDNEIDRKLKLGTYSKATWQAHCDDLFDAIADSGKTYVIPTVEIQYQALQQFLKGNLGANGENDLTTYQRPGLQHLAWSTYAGVKADASGLMDFTIDPVKMPAAIGKYMDTLDGVGWSSIAGWAIPTAQLGNATEIQRRINWFATSADNMAAAGALYYLWYDVLWTNGDYRIETDPAFLAAWTTKLQASGQW